LAEEISAGFEPIEFTRQDEKASGSFIFEKAKSLLPPDAELVSDLFLSSQVRSIENLIARCRYELTDAEIERYRRLGTDAGAAVGDLFKDLNPAKPSLKSRENPRRARRV
jgi:hypothetical protein